jgi:aminoglycoside 3-N-acetyltransferase
MPYSFDELKAAYAALGVSAGRVVYVTSDLIRLGAYQEPGRLPILNAHFRALTDLLGPQGTLVVPTGTTNLCNTDTVFDPATTPVYKVGVLSEYVRTQQGSLRSFHPFVSYAAFGAQAQAITENVSRHAYGPHTPEARMADMDALSISIGLYPRHSCSTVHHVEHLMAVPYRYTKEFQHPVLRRGAIVREPFYLYVWYRNCGIERSNTKWIFERLDKIDLVRSQPVGSGHIFAYPMRSFIENVSKLMIDDMYIWCERPPAIRPWRQ